MSSPWKKKKQPEVVVDAILKRAEVGKVDSPLLNILFPSPGRQMLIIAHRLAAL
jgi:hypothetical protein